MIDVREEVKSAIAKELPDHDIKLETPPDPKMGDFAFPCFTLAKEWKKPPKEVASDLCERIKISDNIRRIEAAGPFLNFYINETKLAGVLLKEILESGEAYGCAGDTSGLVLVESPGPNTNKPLHLGHLRNMLLGQSISRIIRCTGKDAHIVNVVNDRGIHICKSMLAYKRFGSGETPETAGKKPDHFVGEYYVRYSKEADNEPGMEKEIQDMLAKWEKGEPETIDLWKRMNAWAIEGFRQTYARLGFEIEKEYYESDTYKGGKDIIIKAYEQGIFAKDEDGAIIIDLEDKGLGKKVLLRANGTSVYMTQDISMAKLRHEDYGFDEMIYVVASEQKYHFQVLFEIFRRLGWDFADSCYHFAYGMVSLPEGKMKSREGTVVDVDDVLDDMTARAEQEVRERYEDLSDEEVKERAEMIGMAAVRFFFLRYDPLRDFAFNPKESLSFEGETGPYVQYTHARICSILRKSPTAKPVLEPKWLSEMEARRLVKMLYAYPERIKESAAKHNPSIISRYLLDLCQLFNEFYHKYPILKEEKKVRDARLVLIDSIRQVIRNGLQLLGIDAPQRM